MPYTRLSPELERIERSLARGPQPRPSAAFRQRVLDDVRAEMRHRVLDELRIELRREEKRAAWRFAAACALTLLVALTISLGMLHSSGVPLRPPASVPSVDDVAWQLKQLSPEASRNVSFVQATLRQIGAEACCGEILVNIFGETKSHDP